jgi:hypothetical protein
MSDLSFENINIRKPQPRQLKDSVYYELDPDRVKQVMENSIFGLREWIGLQIWNNENDFDIEDYNDLTERLIRPVAEGGFGFTPREIHAAHLIRQDAIVL